MKLVPRKEPFYLSLGSRGEIIACNFLRKKGFRLLEKNYRCPLGEIDIVAVKGKRYHFIEVKTRRDHHFGSPEESVDLKKQKKISKLVNYYLKQEQKYKVSVSLDVLAVDWNEGFAPEIRFLENAFEVSEESWAL